MNELIRTETFDDQDNTPILARFLGSIIFDPWWVSETFDNYIRKPRLGFDFSSPRFSEPSSVITVLTDQDLYMKGRCRQVLIAL